MSTVMVSTWLPVCGVTIKDMGEGRFLFRFYHKLDLLRILDNGPWSYNQSPLILSRIQNNEIPQQVKLDTAVYWVRAYNLPVGFFSEHVAKIISDYIDVFVESDPNNFTSIWRAFLRVRVDLDVKRPLKHRMKLKLEGDNAAWFWVDFKYERLTTFCFLCGLLGHSDRFCPQLYFGGHHQSVERLYGSWMKAPSCRTHVQDGVQWLRPEPEGLPANDNRVDVHYGSGEISGAHEGGMPHFFLLIP